MMQIEALVDANAVAEAAAGFILREAKAAVAARGRFILAVSGGQTPWRMLRALAGKEMPWENVFVFQVDERVAPDGDPDRNLTHLRESLLGQSPLTPAQIYPMPVELPDLETAAATYGLLLRQIAGSPAGLDLVQLGLGSDGHTASLLPGDPAIEVTDRDVAVTGVYQRRRRMTLTYPILNRSRRMLWMITGGEKAAMLVQPSESGSIHSGGTHQSGSGHRFRRPFCCAGRGIGRKGISRRDAKAQRTIPHIHSLRRGVFA